MEEREAIAKLKETTDYRYSHYAYVNDTGKAFDMAIKALEKQGLEKRKSEKSMRIETEKFIEEQPTVERYGNSGMGGELVVNLDDAVEIVKRGGVDESK